MFVLQKFRTEQMHCHNFAAVKTHLKGAKLAPNA
jgi:hypothetical protein